MATVPNQLNKVNFIPVSESNISSGFSEEYSGSISLLRIDSSGSLRS